MALRMASVFVTPWASANAVNSSSTCGDIDTLTVRLLVMCSSAVQNAENAEASS